MTATDTTDQRGPGTGKRGKTIPPEIRKRMIEAREQGLLYREIGERFGYHGAVVGRILRVYRETGSYAPRKRSGMKSQIDDTKMAAICALIESRPGITCKGIKEELGLKMTPRSIAHVIRRRAPAEIREKMSRRLPASTREHIIQDSKNGQTQCAIAKAHGCSETTVYLILRRNRKKRKQTGHKARTSSADEREPR